MEAEPARQFAQALELEHYEWLAYDYLDRGFQSSPADFPGANQVSIITSTAERQAAIEFAKAAAMRPHIVGEALKEIAATPAVNRALFEVLEVQNLLASQARITLLPPNRELLGSLIASGNEPYIGA